MITKIMQDFGVFHGDILGMCYPPGHTKSLAEQLGQSKYGSTTQSVKNYLRWVHTELQGSRAARIERGYCDTSTAIPDFMEWLGEDTRKLLYG